MITETEKNQFTKDSRRLAKWFKIEFTLSIFGQTIIHWVYPPQKED